MPFDRDGKRLTQREAIAIYHPFAFDYLIDTAKVYNCLCTYKELGDHVQEVSEVTYGKNYRWVGKLLAPIVWRCKEEGLPPLSALVVHTGDHRVGEGYDENFRAEGIPVPPADDLPRKLAILDEHAAEARLRCYRFYNARGLPADGGRPTLPPKIRAARDRQRRQEPKPDVYCEKHPGVSLPLSGVCDECA